MTLQASDFLWQFLIKAKLRGVVVTPGELAADCVVAASRLGISSNDLKPAWGTIEGIAADVMHGDVDPELEAYRAKWPRRDTRFRILKTPAQSYQSSSRG